jgi:hypothetical protein
VPFLDQPIRIAPDELIKAEGSDEIDRLQRETGRGA